MPSPIRSWRRASASAPARTASPPICAPTAATLQERDLERLRENIMTKLNLEMGNTPEIVDFALLVPDEVCLVPEKRQEITTEGGLDLVSARARTWSRR